MSDQIMELARTGFQAWQQGDFAKIESLLDPEVRWRWFEPGEWDCESRSDVMHIIRERYEQGFNRGQIDFVDGGEDRVVVIAHPREIGGDGWPEETATVLTFRADRVVDMQDYRTKAEALAALA